MENTVTYYGVSQFNHGAEHKWIFDSKTLSKYVVLDDLIDGDCIDCYFPIGGSNSSCTWFEKLSTDKEIKDFLLRKGDGPDSEDPELVDIAEYYCSVDVNDSWCSDKSCTGKFVEKLGITCEDTHDNRYEEVENMLKALECIGYKDFDFKDPFYGKNRDMRYSELRDLYQQQIAEKLHIHQIYNIVENSYHSSSLSINSYFDDKEKKLSVLACFTIEAGDHIVMCAEKSPEMHGLKLVAEGFTPKLINAESCTFDASHLEQWTYKDENIWEYESLPRHKILEISQKDKLKPEEITAAIVYYEHFNYGLFDSPADGHYSVPMVKQMIEDGFTKDRIAIIGKDWDAKEILKKPEIETFYKKTRDKLAKKSQEINSSKAH